MTIKINEIFYSIQGESSHAGRPCIFIRFTGCNLRCSYCDTQDAFEIGESKTIDEILYEVAQYKAKLIEITGGEPLQQGKECLHLIDELLKKGYEILLETSGSYDISCLPKQVKVILDIKTPDSKMHNHNVWSNLNILNSSSEIKFVLNSEADYIWSKEILQKYLLGINNEIFFSPVTSAVNPKDLANWICRDCLPVKMQLQLHKFIWGDEPEGSKN